MKRLTRYIILAYYIALLLIGIYVPWNSQTFISSGRSQKHITMAVGYSFIWAPPQNSSSSPAAVDMKRVGLEIGIISVIAGMLIFASQWTTRKDNAK